MPSGTPTKPNQSSTACILVSQPIFYPAYFICHPKHFIMPYSINQQKISNKIITVKMNEVEKSSSFLSQSKGKESRKKKAASQSKKETRTRAQD
jgi:hypothetical protein